MVFLWVAMVRSSVVQLQRWRMTKKSVNINGRVKMRWFDLFAWFAPARRSVTIDSQE